MLCVLYNDLLLKRGTDRATLIACLGIFAQQLGPYLQYLTHARRMDDLVHYNKTVDLLVSAYDRYVRRHASLKDLADELNDVKLRLNSYIEALKKSDENRWETSMIEFAANELSGFVYTLKNNLTT